MPYILSYTAFFRGFGLHLKPNAAFCWKCGIIIYIMHGYVITMGRRKKQNIPIYLEVDEIRAMLDHAKSVRDYTLVYLAYKTGLRCHELTSLKIEHIDFETNIITVVSGKGDKDRYVYIDDVTKQKIRNYIKTRKKGILFLSNKRQTGIRSVQRTTYQYDDEGKQVGVLAQKDIPLSYGQLNDATVQRIVRTMANDADIHKAKAVTTHTLRHTFACQALLNGVPITTVQMALGHSSLQTTEIYLKAIQTTKQLKADFEEHPLPNA